MALKCCLGALVSGRTRLKVHSCQGWGKAGAMWLPRQLADGGTRATQLLLFAHGVTARKGKKKRFYGQGFFCCCLSWCGTHSRKGKKKNLRFYFFAFPGVGP